MRALLCLIVIGSLSACCPEGGCPADPDAPPAAPPVATFRVWSGDFQSALAGTALPEHIAVQASNARGVVATFEVRSGGGTLAFGTTRHTAALAGPDNVASVSWRLGPSLGEQVVRVTFDGHPNFLEFRATAHGEAAQVSPVAGQGQTAAPGTAVGIAPRVRVSDVEGRPIPRARVDFVYEGVAYGTRTGDDGRASMPVDWMLGAAAGTYEVAAYYSADGRTYPAILGNPVVFTAAAVPSTATQLVKQGGDAQAAAPGTSVPVRPSVRLADQFGNGVPGVSVTFSRRENAGALRDSVAITDANGVAIVGAWTLGALGTYALTATAPGSGIAGNPAVFTATSALPVGAPARVLIVSGDNQMASVATAVPERLRVRVLDAAGQPVPSVPIRFVPRPGSGSFPSGPGVPALLTNAAGEVESNAWTLGQRTGTQSVDVSILLGSLDIEYPVFRAIATPGLEQRFARVSGDGGTALAGSAVSVAALPTVRLADQFDNPVPGAPITFSASGDGAVTGPASVSTDSLGIARASGWTLGSTAGTNTLTAIAAAPPGVVVTPATLAFERVATLATPNLLVNAGFEAPVSIGVAPGQAGVWSGDAARSATYPYFTPLDGQHVLEFIATGGTVASTNTIASQQWQLVDVTDVRALIDAGLIDATGRASFTRWHGEESDSLFSVRIYAMRGVMSEFVSRYSVGDWLARGIVDLKTDGVISTWQQAETTLTLPAGTTYVAIELIAFEDVRNDGLGSPEFLGHYADGAVLQLVRRAAPPPP